MKKIYLAAAVFSVFERNNNYYIANILKEKGFYEVFLPQEVPPLETATGKDMSYIYQQCKVNIENSDVVVALVDGSDVDSGVAWELGYACAKHVPALCIRTDFRKAEDKGVNVMIEYGSVKTVYLTKYHQTMEEIAYHILQELEDIQL